MITRKEYKGYAIAMSRNDCIPISYNRLYDHIERNCYLFRKETAWIAGQFEGDVFFASHVGYESGKDIVSLLKELLDGEILVCFAVKANIGAMLQKIGYIYAQTIQVDYPFVQEKTVYVNDMSLVPKAFWSIIDDEEQ